MTKFLLVLHVLAAVVAVGPVTVAASMFPPALRRAHQAPTLVQAQAQGLVKAQDQAQESREARTTLAVLHRICRVYAAVGVAVPVFGFATASSLGVLGDAWLIVSIVLTAAAAAVLAFLLLPAQERALTLQGTAATAIAPRLAMLTGVFNLLWATVTVLMIIRPGSTTGA